MIPLRSLGDKERREHQIKEVSRFPEILSTGLALDSG